MSRRQGGKKGVAETMNWLRENYLAVSIICLEIALGSFLFGYIMAYGDRLLKITVLATVLIWAVLALGAWIKSKQGR